MKKYGFYSGAFAAALFFMAVFPACAEENSLVPGSFSGNVALTSEYSFRGIAQSDEQPALQGGVDWAHDSGFYLGVWGSSVDFNDGDEASVEVDLYGGLTGNLTENTGWDIGFIYYAYPGADSNLDYDFIEAKAALSHDFGSFAATASINYSPDYFAGSGDAFYYSLNAEAPLPHNFTLNGHAAYQSIDDEGAFGVPDYLDWSAGLGYAWDRIDLSLNYQDTNLDETDCVDGCSGRFIFAVKYNI